MLTLSTSLHCHDNVAPVNNVAHVNRACYSAAMTAKRPYHHGNLKPVLLRAAIRLIAEVGPAAFTMREVARRAGISHNAPYRHLQDKDALLAAVATEGFERLAKALSKPIMETHTAASATEARGVAEERPALRRFKASGLAYVRFALRSPEHLLVMFDWPLPLNRYPDLEAAAARAFSILVGLVQEAQREGSLPEGDAIVLARIAWSLVHGVAKLAIGKRLALESEAELMNSTTRALDILYVGMARWR